MPSDSGTSHTYRLKFIPDALDEWQKLDGSIKELFRKALKKRLVQPHQPGSRLHGELNFCYKIKLQKHGYRLVCTVEDDQLVVLVLAIDKREYLAAYHSAMLRLMSKK